MSLKAFHLVFIIASVLLMLCISAWCWGNYKSGGSTADLTWAACSALGAVALAAYGRYFTRKLKNISYL